MTSSTPPPASAKGFFATLFDFDFTNFLTLKFLKVIYAALAALLLLMGFVYLILGLARGGGIAVAALLLVPVITLVYLVVLRISLEVVALFFQIGENTNRLVQLQDNTRASTVAHDRGAGKPAPPYGGTAV